MKVLEKITLILYSIIILTISIILCMVIFKWVDLNNVLNEIAKLVNGDTSSKVILIFSIIFIILSIKCIFFRKSSGRDGQGVLLQNENGRLMISKNTIENLVTAATRKYHDAQEITTSVHLDSENNVLVNANIVVTDEAMIKDLSANIQNEIKERIKRATDLDVKQVNIRVRNAVDQKPVEAKPENNK